MPTLEDRITSFADGVGERELLTHKALNGAAFAPDRRRLTVSEDTATVAFNTGGDASYDRAYVRGAGALPPASWPVDQGPCTEYNGGGDYWYVNGPTYNGTRTFRVMVDRDSIAFWTYGTAGNLFTIKVDGAPLSAAPYSFPTTATQLVTIVFAGGHKNRLIEVSGDFPSYSWATKKPGRLWKPAPQEGPLIGVIGNSYSAPAVYNDAGTVIITAGVLGMYQRLAPLLGVRDLVVDGYGGTGYINDGSFVDYIRRLAGEGTFDSIADFKPDVLIIDGPGNDIYAGALDAAILAAVTTAFQNARALLPKAKLVYLEGLAPPGFAPGTYNPRYISIRAAAQTALAATGVYYVDQATSNPWLAGAGRISLPHADLENANIYIGDDYLHLNAAGHAHLANRLAGPLRRILRDRGALLNQLVA